MNRVVIMMALLLVIGLALGHGNAAAGKAEVPAPSGWDGKGNFAEGDGFKICSVTADTTIIRYWQTPFGGVKDATYAIVTSQDSLQTIWSKLRIAPEQPKIDFANSFLVVMQPGKSITQYNYNLIIHEEPTTIHFTLNEYHTQKDSHWLMGQEAILVF